MVKKELTDQEKDLYNLLDNLGIKYQTMYHDPIQTVEEGKNITKLINGTVCKNLLLTGKEYYLYATNITTEIDMKTLHKELGEKKVRFADKSKLQELLNVQPGCATVLSLINDKEKKIKVVLDDTVKKSQICFHPMRNDATTTISYVDLLKFLNHLGYTPIYVQC